MQCFALKCNLVGLNNNMRVHLLLNCVSKNTSNWVFIKNTLSVYVIDDETSCLSISVITTQVEQWRTIAS